MSTTMLYKAPGPHDIHGGKFDYKIVPDHEIEDHLDNGWHKTTPDAKAAHEAAMKAKAEAAAQPIVPVQPPVPKDSDPPTLDELRQKATELGIDIDQRWREPRLTAEIEAAMKAKA